MQYLPACLSTHSSMTRNHYSLTTYTKRSACMPFTSFQCSHQARSNAAVLSASEIGLPNAGMLAPALSAPSWPLSRTQGHCVATTDTVLHRSHAGRPASPSYIHPVCCCSFADALQHWRVHSTSSRRLQPRAPARLPYLVSCVPACGLPCPQRLPRTAVPHLNLRLADCCCRTSSALDKS